MPSLLTAPLDFPLSPLTSLSSTQLALARLHPDFEESDGLRICQLYYYKREKAQQARKRSSSQIEDEDTKFALIDLDFRLDGNLEGLNEEQLAAVVVLAHPDASELHVLKAERIWRKRREKAALTARTAPRNVEKQAKEVPAPAPRADRSELKVSTGRPITPAPSSASTTTAERPPSPKQTRPPPPPSKSVVVPPRRRRTPRPIPPLPSVETRLPDSLCREVYPLKLSNLPLSEIKTRDDVSSLFPRSLLPDAVILHRPSNPEDISRTAYVGWVFDFEKRTEAMQEVIRVRMGRWRAMAEFVDCEKPKWEWGDLAKIKREQVWKRWNEQEQEKEYKKEEEEARKQAEVAANPGGQTVDEDEEEDEGGYLVAPESEDPEPATMEDVIPQASSPPLLVQHRDAEEEPEAIVLDSPALPPIPSRAPSRAGSSRNDSTHSFQPPPPSPPRVAAPARPPPRQNPEASTSQRSIAKPASSRPSSPRRSSPPVVERAAPPPPPAQARDRPPHITRDHPPPPQISSANSLPTGPRVSSNGRPTHQSAARPQPQFVNSPPPSRPQNPNPNPSSRPPPPAPSLLARTTELEVRGSAPTPPSVAPTPSSAAQAKKPSLMDRVNGNGGTPSTASSSKSASPPVTRAQSPQTGHRNQPAARASPGVTKGGGNANGKGRGQGQGQGQGQNQGQNRSQGNSNNSKQQSHQQQQQQQQQQQRGKKRGPANDFDNQANARGGGGGNSILDRIEGGGSNGQGQGSGRGGTAKKQRGNGGGNGGNDGGGSLLSRLG